MSESKKLPNLLELFVGGGLEQIAKAIFINNGTSEVPEVAKSAACTLAFFNGVLTGWKIAGGSEIQIQALQQRIKEIIAANVKESVVEVPNPETVAALTNPKSKLNYNFGNRDSSNKS